MTTETIQETNQPTKQLLTLKDVTAMTGLSSTTIYKFAKSGKFPQPKRIGDRAVRWRLADVQTYINA